MLASRLSENAAVSVVVLEAGNAHVGDPFVGAYTQKHWTNLGYALNPICLLDLPDGWMKQLLNPEYDWVFRTIPQKTVQNGITTPDGKPDPSFYWSRYVVCAYCVAMLSLMRT